MTWMGRKRPESPTRQQVGIRCLQEPAIQRKLAEMITNVDVYFAIAAEAQVEAERLENLSRRPNPDNPDGFVIAYDSERKSFKHALIAITFAGIYLECLLNIVGNRHFGRKKYNKKHDHKCYEKKLMLLGITDEALLEDAKNFRKVRRDLVHEKAIELDDLSPYAANFAQHEAKRAVSFVKTIANKLASQSVEKR